MSGCRKAARITLSSSICLWQKHPGLTHRDYGRSSRQDDGHSILNTGLSPMAYCFALRQVKSPFVSHIVCPPHNRWTQHKSSCYEVQISRADLLTLCLLSNILRIKDKFQLKTSVKPVQPAAEQNWNRDPIQRNQTFFALKSCSSACLFRSSSSPTPFPSFTSI